VQSATNGSRWRQEVEVNTKNRKLTPVLVPLALAALNPGCRPFVPACAPPPPTSPEYQCSAPPTNWPQTAVDAQESEEDGVYFAKSFFSALPPATQQKYQADYDKALTAVNGADQTFIAVINAIVAGKQGDVAGAIAALTQAVATLVATIEGFNAQSPPPSGSDQITNARVAHADFVRFSAKISTDLKMGSQ
jgi:hypothetical protein